jgi:DUF2917 family protein
MTHTKGLAMNASLNRYEIGLAPRGLLEIPDAAGVRVSCNEGCLWITLDNDPRDIVLEPGQYFAGTQHRRALVYALQASTLGLRLDAQVELAAQVPRISFASGAFAP